MTWLTYLLELKGVKMIAMTFVAEHVALNVCMRFFCTLGNTQQAY